LWDWNLLSAEVYFSPRWMAMLGYEAHELAPHLTTFQALLCLEDRERVYALMRAFLEGRADKFEIEFRMLHKHGHLVPVLSRAHVARNAEGQPVRMIGTHMDLTERKRAEAELQESHKKLIAASRQAGMAEVATNILHNVGNVLNSVNVSVRLIGERLQLSKAASVTRLAELLSEHRGDFSDFVTNDPRGRQLPDFVGQLARRLSAERNRMLGDLAQLRRQVDHIKRVVAMQQDHAKVSCFSEDTNITELIEDAVRLNGGGVAKQDLHVVREYAAVPTITVDRHKVLQILVNLVRNARNACEESGQAEKRLTLKVANDTEQVRISVSDNGVGIPAENLTRIFNHGFTTRKDGHGFGLHSAALAACELGGTLSVHSDGPGRGATFTLELPLQSNFANQ
jgi:PAS domain S-box-containing protein